MLRMDQVHVIRHQVLVEGRSQRQVPKTFGTSRLTVRKYVSELSMFPPDRMTHRDQLASAGGHAHPDASDDRWVERRTGAVPSNTEAARPVRPGLPTSPMVISTTDFSSAPSVDRVRTSSATTTRSPPP